MTFWLCLFLLALLPSRALPQESSLSDTLSWLPDCNYGLVNFVSQRSVQANRELEAASLDFIGHQFNSPADSFPASWRPALVWSLTAHGYQLSAEEQLLLAEAGPGPADDERIRAECRLGVYEISGLGELIAASLKDGALRETGEKTGSHAQYRFEDKAAAAFAGSTCIAAAPDILIVANDPSLLKRCLAAHRGDEPDFASSGIVRDCFAVIPSGAVGWHLHNNSARVAYSLLAGAAHSDGSDRSRKLLRERMAKLPLPAVWWIELTGREIVGCIAQQFASAELAGERAAENSAARDTEENPVIREYTTKRAARTAPTVQGNWLLHRTVYDAELAALELKFLRALDEEKEKDRQAAEAEMKRRMEEMRKAKQRQ